MILSNFRTFTKKVCNGNEQTAYRYLAEIERHASGNGEYGRELLNGIDYADEIPDKIIYKLYGGIDFCHDDFGNDESTDNNIVNEIMESVYGETIKK